MPLNYALADREHPRMKAALTRAVNSKSADAVLAACQKAVRAWATWGAWPDDWSRWQRALDDAFLRERKSAPRLDDI